MADPKKIIIVEDEETLLKALEHKLSLRGYQVFLARDGAEGLKLINEVNPDIVLLDILMPNVDGFGVMEQLNKDGIIPKLPVIIISNSGQPVEIDRAMRLGARDYLVKAEFDPQEVLEKVEAVFASAGAPVGEVSILPPSAEVASTDDSGKKRILIIEDDQFLRDLMERKLIKEGFVVDTAIEGETGLSKIQSAKPDVVLLDIILPGLDGFSILEKVKNNPAMSNIPVILLSNLGQRDDVDKGMKLGAVDYLVKAHFTPGDIVEKVRAVLK
jgi:DNA-binding response OmpR family regulator